MHRLVIKSNKFLFTLLLIGFGLFYFFYQNEQNDLQQESIMTNPSNDLEGLVFHEEPNQPYIKERLHNVPKFEYSKTDVTERYMASCGDSPETGDKLYSKLISIKNLSEKQYSMAHIQDQKCEDWYDYLKTLSNKEKNHLDKVTHENKELKGYYHSLEKNSENLLEARTLVSDMNVRSLISAEALKYLLKYDHNFLYAIADKLGISAIEYIQQNKSNIAILYSCLITNNLACAPGSFNSVTICLVYGDEFCGISVQDFMAIRTTPNNYADLQQIIDIIIQLINENYFEDNIVKN